MLLGKHSGGLEPQKLPDSPNTESSTPLMSGYEETYGTASAVADTSCNASSSSDCANGRITIFSLEHCPHCKRTKTLFRDLGWEFYEISLTDYPDAKTAMLRLSNRLTVPQVKKKTCSCIDKTFALIVLFVVAGREFVAVLVGFAKSQISNVRHKIKLSYPSYHSPGFF